MGAQQIQRPFPTPHQKKKKKERPGRDSEEEEITGAGSLVEGVLAEGTSLRSSTRTGAEDRRASLVLRAPGLVLRPRAVSRPRSRTCSCTTLCSERMLSGAEGRRQRDSSADLAFPGLTGSLFGALQFIVRPSDVTFLDISTVVTPRSSDGLAAMKAELTP